MTGTRSLTLGVVVVLGATVLGWPTEVGAAGEFVVAPTTLSFPATYVGDESTIAVTISNVSGSTLSPNFSGGAPLDADNFGGSQNCAGKTFAPGDSCTFTYEFTPESAGQHSSSTTIGIDSENFAISMSGVGLFPFSLSPTTLAFPDTPVGQTSSIDVVVRNDSPVSQSPNFSGGAPLDPANFGGSQNCAGKTFAPGATCAFTYEFTPTTAGPLTSSTTIGVDSENFPISLSGTGGGAADTGLATSTTPSSTSTTSSTTTAPAAAPTSVATTEVAGTTSVVTSTGTIQVTPGPLSDGGDAHVIAQGIVELPAGSLGWLAEPLDLAAGPLSFEQSPPAFLAATSVAPLLVRADGQSAALLDQGEAFLVPAGSTGDVSSLALDGAGTALRISLVPSAEPFSFTPGAGRRDVNLVGATLRPGDRLHVVSTFPVLVAVTGGVIHDAPEGTQLDAGSSRAFVDADLSNDGAVPATVLIAAVGSPVP